MHRDALLALLVATHVVPAGGAHALLLCARKDSASGAIKEGTAIRIRAGCRAKEIALPVSLEDGGATARFTGVNVRIISGAGQTPALDGKGNLITRAKPCASTPQRRNF